MRNLKKILALVLALTMVLGLSISASAGTFTDVNEDDDYAAAIELLASLDVLAGMGDGTYNAAGSYTREQFTKILYVLVTGKDDGAAMYTEVAPFPDVAADRWSAGYINWAVQLGILVGRDDGLFHPTDVVNYAEACKMFLIAMGYSASMYTYPYGFIDKADSLKLFDDINGYATYAPANRGTVAQMGYNALFAEAPRFGTYIAKEGETSKTETRLLIMGAFGVTKGLGTLVGTSTDAYDSIVYADGQVDLMFRVYNEKTKAWEVYNDVFEYAEDVDDLIGMQVFVWSKADENALSGEKIYLIEDAGKDKAYIVNPYDVIEIADTTANRVSFKDGEVTRRIKIDANTRGIDWEGKLWGTLHDKASWEADKDVLYRAIDTGNDGDFDDVYVIKPDFARITALSDDKVSLSAGHLVGSNDIMEDDDVVIALEDGLKKDDYVLVFPRKAVIGNSVDDAFAVIKAPVVEAVKLTKQSDEYDYYADVAYRYAYAENNVDLGKTYNLYLNANGFIAKAVEIEDEADGNYILVTAVYNNITNVDGANPKLFGASVTGYLADGTKKTFSIDIDEVTEIYDAAGAPLYINKESKDWAKFAGNEGWQPAAEDEYAIYCYGLNDDGVIDDLEFVAGNVNDLDEVYNATLGKANGLPVKYNETSTLLSAADNAGKAVNIGFITSGTVIYNVDNDGDVSVLGADDMVAFDSINENDKHVYTQAGVDGGNVKVVLIYEAIKKTSDKYGLIISGIKNDVSSTKANYTVKVAVDGEIVELTTKNVDKFGGKNLFVASDRYDKDTNATGFVNDDLKTASGDPVVGYARITLNASGKIDTIDMLKGNGAAIEDGDAELVTRHAVTAIPNSKGVAVRDTKIKHDVNGDCVLTGLENSALEKVLEYDSDVAFYTIGVEPCGTVTNTKKIAAATADALMKSDLTTDVDKYINSDDTVYAIDVIMMQDDGENSDVAKAIFIYTTPVSGREIKAGEKGTEKKFANAGVEDDLEVDGTAVKAEDIGPAPANVGDPATKIPVDLKLNRQVDVEQDANEDGRILADILTSVFFGNRTVYAEKEVPARAVVATTLEEVPYFTFEYIKGVWTLIEPTEFWLLDPADTTKAVGPYAFNVKATVDSEAGGGTDTPGEGGSTPPTSPVALTTKNVALSATEGKLESGSATLPTVTVNVEGVVANTDYTVTWYLGETKIEGTTVNTAGEYKAVVEATEVSKVVSGKVELTFTVKGTTGGEVDASLPKATKVGATVKVPYYGGADDTKPTKDEVLAKLQADLPALGITDVKVSAGVYTAYDAKDTAYTVNPDRYFKVTVGDKFGYGKGTAATVNGAAAGSYLLSENISAAAANATIDAAGAVTLTAPLTLTKDITLVEAVEIDLDSTTGTGATDAVKAEAADAYSDATAISDGHYVQVGKKLIVNIPTGKTVGNDGEKVTVTAGKTVVCAAEVKTPTTNQKGTYTVDAADKDAATGKIILTQTAGFELKIGTTAIEGLFTKAAGQEIPNGYKGDYVELTNTKAHANSAITVASGLDANDNVIGVVSLTGVTPVDGVVTLLPATRVTFAGTATYTYGKLKDVTLTNKDYVAQGAEVVFTASGVDKYLNVKVGDADAALKGVLDGYANATHTETIGTGAVVVTEVTQIKAIPFTGLDSATIADGKTLATPAGASGVAVRAVTWTKDGDAYTGPYVSGDKVVVTFTVTANTGYTLKDLESVTATGNTFAAAPSITNVTGESATIAMTFTVA